MISPKVSNEEADQIVSGWWMLTCRNLCVLSSLHTRMSCPAHTQLALLRSVVETALYHRVAHARLPDDMPAHLPLPACSSARDTVPSK